MSTIAVIDYGMGNLRSVAKALERVAGKTHVLVTQNSGDILAADRVVLPGQGAIRALMDELGRLDLIDAVRRAAAEKPFLGICMGPQALLDHSEENGGIDALGIMPGKVLKFPSDMRTESNELLKIPHMGWNEVQQTHTHPVWSGIADNSRFYFVHSYYMQPADPSVVAGETEYGLKFASAIAKDNIFAAQFHPEKSARDGLRLLANFVEWNPL